MKSVFLHTYYGVIVPIGAIVPLIIFYCFVMSYLSKMAFHGMLLTSQDTQTTLKTLAQLNDEKADGEL